MKKQHIFLFSPNKYPEIAIKILFSNKNFLDTVTKIQFYFADNIEHRTQKFS